MLIVDPQSAGAVHPIVGFVELGAADLIAHLLAHLSHHSGDALRVVFVETGEGGRVGERVDPRLLALRRRETRHQALHLSASAMAADGVDLLAHAHREHAGTPMALVAFVLVNRHSETPPANTSPIRSMILRTAPGARKPGDNRGVSNFPPNYYCRHQHWISSRCLRFGDSPRSICSTTVADPLSPPSH